MISSPPVNNSVIISLVSNVATADLVGDVMGFWPKSRPGQTPYYAIAAPRMLLQHIKAAPPRDYVTWL